MARGGAQDDAVHLLLAPVAGVCLHVPRQASGALHCHGLAGCGALQQEHVAQGSVKTVSGACGSNGDLYRVALSQVPCQLDYATCSEVSEESGSLVHQLYLSKEIIVHAEKMMRMIHCWLEMTRSPTDLEELLAVLVNQGK